MLINTYLVYLVSSDWIRPWERCLFSKRVQVPYTSLILVQSDSLKRDPKYLAQSFCRAIWLSSLCPSKWSCIEGCTSVNSFSSLWMWIRHDLDLGIWRFGLWSCSGFWWLCFSDVLVCVFSERARDRGSNTIGSRLNRMEEKVWFSYLELWRCAMELCLMCNTNRISGTTHCLLVGVYMNCEDLCLLQKLFLVLLIFLFRSPTWIEPWIESPTLWTSY